MKTIWLRLETLIAKWLCAVQRLPGKVFGVVRPLFVGLVAFVGILIFFSENNDDTSGLEIAWETLKSGFAYVSAQGVAIATGQEPTDVLPAKSLPGFLYIEAPQLYTRERLVNDRFRQANWLSKELERTTEAGDADRFATASRVEQRNQRIRFMAQFGEGAIVSNPKTQSGSSEMKLQPALDQLKLLERRISYRSELRNELMDTQLDDGHDLDGNTLYRLNFDAIAMPWADLRGNPGAAIFIVTARKADGSQANGGNDKQQLDLNLKQILDDDLHLLRSWQREMQMFLSRVLSYRTEQFKRKGELPNRTDPKEDVAFDWFLRVKLIESFLDVLVSRVDLKFNCRMSCDEDTVKIKMRWEEPDSKKRWTERRDLFAEWIGLAYRTGKKTPKIEIPAMRANFRMAIRRASEVNNKRWRAALGDQAYAKGCVEVWKREHKAHAEGSPKPEFCARSLPDPNNLSAIVRLISVVETIKDGPTTEGAKPFQLNFVEGDAKAGPKGLKTLVELFNGIVPSREEINAKAREWEGSIGREKLARNFEDFCFNEAEDNAANYKEFIVGAKTAIFFEYGKCNFLNASAGIAAEKMIAKFIQARLNGSLPSYGSTERRVGEFLRVELTGCDFTRCRFEIRKRAPLTKSKIMEFKKTERYPARGDDYLRKFGVKVEEQPRCAISVSKYFNGFPDELPKRDPIEDSTSTQSEKVEKTALLLEEFTELYAACRIRAWLDARRNDLVVYGVSPRLRGDVTTQDANHRSELAASGTADLIPGVTLGAGRQRELQRSETSIKPSVIGFSQLSPKGQNPAKPRRETVFGWVVRSSQLPDGSWKAGHHRLAAVLSVPSWWKRLEFEVLACWSSPTDARKLGQHLFDNPTAVCPVSGNVEKGPYRIKRIFRIQLPRRAEDVTARFDFDFIKAPYFEPGWSEGNDKAPIKLEVGRGGRVVLPGERLWRGTVVTLGEQPADKIVVLPDMKGVIAEFECVNAPPGEDYIIKYKSLAGHDTGREKKTAGEKDQDKISESQNPEYKNKSKTDKSQKSDKKSQKPADKNQAKTGEKQNEDVAKSSDLQVALTVWTAEGRTPLGTVANLLPFVQRTPNEKPCFALN